MDLTKSFLGEISVSYKKAEEPTTLNIRRSADASAPIIELVGNDMLIKERFVVLYLNRAHNVMWAEVNSIGTATGTQVDVKSIVRRAVCGGAQSIIIGHNHPSGQLVPSENDRRMTKKIRDGLKMFDITLLDHLIVTEDGFFSFSDQGEPSV